MYEVAHLAPGGIPSTQRMRGGLQRACSPIRVRLRRGPRRCNFLHADSRFRYLRTLQESGTCKVAGDGASCASEGAQKDVGDYEELEPAEPNETLIDIETDEDFSKRGRTEGPIRIVPQR
jgi:hypothetical protein